MLRILFFILCLYIFYLLFFSKKKDDKKSRKQRFRVVYPPPDSNPPSQNLIVDEMKRCPACGTFNPKSHAVESHGEYFCNEECRDKRV